VPIEGRLRRPRCAHAQDVLRMALLGQQGARHLAVRDGHRVQVEDFDQRRRDGASQATRNQRSVPGWPVAVTKRRSSGGLCIRSRRSRSHEPVNRAVWPSRARLTARHTICALAGLEFSQGRSARALRSGVWVSRHEGARAEVVGRCALLLFSMSRPRRKRCHKWCVIGPQPWTGVHLRM
jgi:hypothetical protein